MLDKRLHKLRRGELLEMLLDMERENENLAEENARLRDALLDRERRGFPVTNARFEEPPKDREKEALAEENVRLREQLREKERLAEENAYLREERLREKERLAEENAHLREQLRENESLAKENARLKERFQSPSGTTDKVGSIAEASVKITDLFGTAQKAVDYYLNSVRELTRQQRKDTLEKVAETKRRCMELAKRTEEACLRQGGKISDPSLTKQVEEWFSAIERRQPRGMKHELTGG
ncbi:MAG: hypothetical protein ACSW75_02230 [Lachnospiraceae bacterium]